MVFFQHKGNIVKGEGSTDEESGVYEIDDLLLRNTDVRAVTSRDSGQGFETSFLVIEGKATHSEDFYNDGEDDDHHHGAHEDQSWRGTWLCRPYKRERLLEEIHVANRRGSIGHAAVLNTLKNTGIIIFIVDAKVSMTTADVMDSIRNVLHHVSKEERARPGLNSKNKIAQRCLLYRDHEGRFFNLTLADHSASLAGAWEEKWKSFSVFQALAVLTILTRSFACVTQTDTIIEEFRPAYLALLLGLVFVEEISLSWTNVAMMVRGMPSLAAYTVRSGVDSDWLRKTLLFTLLMTSATTGIPHLVLTLLGIGLTCAILLANLGSRAWGFLRWRPIGCLGMFEPLVAFLVAMVTGVCVPYLGHRQVESGGKAAMESVIRLAFLVGILFIVSDYDEIQKFLVIGSENCNQNYVNLGFGIWWTLSLIASLFVILRKEREGIWLEDEEPLLEKDHSSPVGFKVPNLPDFPMDPSMAARSIPLVSIHMEFFFGVLMALALGGGMCFLAFTDMVNDLIEPTVSQTVQANIFANVN
jgi:hypothetical protein